MKLPGMAIMTSRPKRSLLFDQPETSNDRYLRNYYLDLGLDPDNPGQALVDGGGMSSAFGRQALRTVSRNNSRTAGARVLTPEELTSAWALKEKSPEQGGTFYDNMDDPRHQSVTKKFWADRVNPVRQREGGGMETVPSFEFQDAVDQKAEADWDRQQIAGEAVRRRTTRAKRVNAFDIEVASGREQANDAYRRQLAGLPRRWNADNGPMGKVRSRIFGDFGDSGGEMVKDGETFRTAPGTVGAPKYRAPVRRKAPSFEPQGIGQQHEAPDRPDPYAEDPNMMQNPVVDRRYQGALSTSRTGAKALAAPDMPEDPALFARDHPNLAAFNDLAGMRSVDPWLDAVGGAWSDIKSKAAKPKRVFDAWSESQHEAELRRQARMRASQRPRPQSIAGPRSSLYGVRQAPSFAVASGY